MFLGCSWNPPLHPQALCRAWGDSLGDGRYLGGQLLPLLECDEQGCFSAVKWLPRNKKKKRCNKNHRGTLLGWWESRPLLIESVQHHHSQPIRRGANCLRRLSFFLLLVGTRADLSFKAVSDCRFTRLFLNCKMRWLMPGRVIHEMVHASWVKQTSGWSASWGQWIKRATDSQNHFVC